MMLDKKIQNFWNWFLKDANKYYELETDQTNLLFTLKKKLEKIYPDLTFEISKILPSGNRELVISADGIKSIFDLVTQIVENAPSIEKWEIIAFRQPKQGSTTIKYRNLVIDARQIYMDYKILNQKISLSLFIKEYFPSPEWNAGIFILLDNLIGEYNTETMISEIKKFKLINETTSGLTPLAELPKIVKALKN